MVSFHYSKLYIHLTFQNVLSHLLGRRRGPLELITNIYIYIYICIHLTFPNVLSHLLGRRHGPLPLITQFYIHITFPNVLSDLLGRREVNCKDEGEVNDINERWLRWRREEAHKRRRKKGEKRGCLVLLLFLVGCDFGEIVWGRRKEVLFILV